MQISSRFTIAVHMLCYIALFQDKEKVTSDIMAGSINANPVVVRRLLSQLKQRGMVTVNRGSGGAFLAMKPEDIDFLQIYSEKGRYLPFPRKPESQLSGGTGDPSGARLETDACPGSYGARNEVDHAC